jgi:hypothetical protein
MTTTMKDGQRSTQLGVHRQLEEIFRFPMSQHQQQAAPKMGYDAVMDVVDPSKLARVLRNCFQIADDNHEAQRSVFISMENSLIRCIEIYESFKSVSTFKQSSAAGQHQLGNLNHVRNKMASKEQEYKHVDQMMTCVIGACEKELIRAYNEANAEIRETYIDVRNLYHVTYVL